MDNKKLFEEKKRLNDVLAEVMQEKFKGDSYRVGRQHESGVWLENRTRPDCWKNLYKEHLLYHKTYGIYPIKPDGMVSTMAIDIDNKGKRIDEYDFIQNTVLPVIFWYEKLGVSKEQMLIEHTGESFHIWFWVESPLSAKSAVQFLSDAKLEYNTEIFPANPYPNKTSKAIRVPLGVHRVRLIENPSDAYSFLCKMSHGMIEKVQDAEETLNILWSWKPLQSKNVVRVQENENTKIFSPNMINDIHHTLIKIRDNEQRACIKIILLYPTLEGMRNDMSFTLALYLQNNLRMKHDLLQELMVAWKDSLTIPALSWEELQNNIRGARNYYKPIHCRNRVLSSICITHDLSKTCQYCQRVASSLPVKDKTEFKKLVSGKSSLSKIELALRKLFHSRGVNPIDGNGWMTITWDDLATAADLQRATVQSVKTSGIHKGRKPLDVLKDQGVLDYMAEKGSKFLRVKILARK